MKYGLITFKETENIGDDIQSYAAKQFLPKTDYYIEREKMDLFLPKKKEQVVTIMNGWYLHSKINFPISPYIYPLYISVHFSAYNSGGIKTEYLNQYSSFFLNKYGPIGCRDHGTMQLLDEHGIKNYFSGCLTLSIKKDKNIKKTNSICIVDIDEKAEEKIKGVINDDTKIIKRTHILDKKKNMKLSWETRFKNVKALLDTYQSAKLVVTSRLHCALPCLALDTPVLLLYDEDKAYTKDRLSDYAEILNHMTTKEFISRGYKTLNSINSNPSDYMEIRKKIQSKVKSLLKKVEVNVSYNLPNLKDYEELYIKPKLNIDELYAIAITDMYVKKRDFINLKHERNYWKKEYNNAIKSKDIIIENKNNEIIFMNRKINQLENELNKIINSKGYKFIEKARNIKNKFK